MEKTNENMIRTIEGKTKEEFKERLENFVNLFTVGSTMAQMLGTSNGYCFKCTQDVETLIQACDKDANGNYFVNVEVAKVALIPNVHAYNFQQISNKRKGR